MINSMTAFARQEIHSEIGTVVWELRSVNHRFLEITLRLPEPLRGLESVLREMVKQKFLRGKIECSLSFYADSSRATKLVINEPLVAQLVQGLQRIKELVNNATVNSMDILRWPEVIQTLNQWPESAVEQISDSFAVALDEMQQTRAREGHALQTAIEECIGQMQNIVNDVKGHLPQLVQQERERIQSRVASMQVELDPHRLEQEIAILAQKMDVAEELTRLLAHISEVRRVMSQKGAAGRRLDFLLQEMQREANTLGSKSIDVATSHAAVDLKVLVEQIREQVQNIE